MACLLSTTQRKDEVKTTRRGPALFLSLLYIYIVEPARVMELAALFTVDIDFLLEFPSRHKASRAGLVEITSSWLEHLSYCPEWSASLCCYYYCCQPLLQLPGSQLRQTDSLRKDKGQWERKEKTLENDTAKRESLFHWINQQIRRQPSTPIGFEIVFLPACLPTNRKIEIRPRFFPLTFVTLCHRWLAIDLPNLKQTDQQECLASS